MKELPILFSPAMVQANLAGRKTQTRRIIKHSTPEMLALLINLEAGINVEKNKAELVRCCSPYGQAGDILFVRESWKLKGWDFEEQTADFEYTNGSKLCMNAGDYVDDQYCEWLQNHIDKLESKGIVYPVFNEEEDTDDLCYKFTDKHHPFSPSIHLPKWGSRIWLRGKAVCAERLQEITAADAIAEGIEKLGDVYRDYSIKEEENEGYNYFRNPIDSFKSLWMSIYGEECWNENPWVWVVEYEVLSTTGKPSPEILQHAHS